MHLKRDGESCTIGWPPLSDRTDVWRQFLGSIDVEKPKGIDVVQEAIRKLRFSQQIRKAEGQRTPKAELTVSVDGVRIQEPKGKVRESALLICPSARPLASFNSFDFDWGPFRSASSTSTPFIASLTAPTTRPARSSSASSPRGAAARPSATYLSATTRYGRLLIIARLESSSLSRSIQQAEEITLTIGQAFDLAYSRYFEPRSRASDGEVGHDGQLERQNDILRRRVVELSALIETRKLSAYLSSNGVICLPVSPISLLLTDTPHLPARYHPCST